MTKLEVGREYWFKGRVIDHEDGWEYFYVIAKENFLSEVLATVTHAVKITEAEAKEKYPNFKWVSLEELENE